jgi:hypothetical protein
VRALLPPDRLLNIAWVAGAIRGRALASRGLGEEALERLGRQPSLAAALALLSGTTYGHTLDPGMGLAAAQRAVARTALWHLRVLAGWLPPRGVQGVRAVAGWWESGNLEALAIAVARAGRPGAAPYPLGALATVWGRASEAQTLQDLRSVLARSDWGDPGGDTLSDILFGVRLGWARLLHRAVPECPEWGAGALALVAAKTRFLDDVADRRGAQGVRRIPELGRRWEGAVEMEEFVSSLPVEARWVVREVDSADELWRSELNWWARVAADANALLRGRFPGRPMVIGSAATLLTDSWRVGTALARAARGAATSGFARTARASGEQSGWTPREDLEAAHGTA